MKGGASTTALGGPQPANTMMSDSRTGRNFCCSRCGILLREALLTRTDCLTSNPNVAQNYVYLFSDFQ